MERLSIQVTHAGGAVTRWAADEPAAENIPAGLSWQTAIPGGYTSCTFTLPRRITQDYPDLNLFDDVKVLAPGGEVRWHGYVAQLPREHADRPQVQVGCVGWSGALKWDTSFREIYVDRDLSKWTGMGAARQAASLAAAYTDLHEPGVIWDSTGPALGTIIQRDIWDSTHKPICEAWYDARGISIGSLYYEWKRNGGIDHTDTNWDWRALLADDDIRTNVNNDSNLRAAGPGTGTATASGVTKDHALVHVEYTAAGGVASSNISYSLLWTALKVYGTHGLTKQGTEPDAGYYASDIINDVVARQCPFMERSIDATSFVVPQAAYSDPTTADDVILDCNKFHLWEHGCRTSSTGAPEFFYRAPTDELVWEARLDQGAKLSLEGDDSTGWWNGVVVFYTDGYGRQRVAGPTGYTLANVTDDGLLDTSDSNPVNAHGLGRKWAVLNLSNPTTDAGAVQIGAAWLSESTLPQRRGSITLSGTVTHPQEGPVPVTRVKAGSWIKVADKPGDVARRIVSTSYTHPGQITCDVGGMPARVEAILERLGVVLGGRL